MSNWRDISLEGKAQPARVVLNNVIERLTLDETQQTFGIRKASNDAVAHVYLLGESGETLRYGITNVEQAEHFEKWFMIYHRWQFVDRVKLALAKKILLKRNKSNYADAH